jgi:hypothetical protein
MSDDSNHAGVEPPPVPTEREKWILEKQLRTRELDLKEQELRLRILEGSRSRWTTPLVVTLAAAVVAAIGNLVVTFLNGTDQRRLQAENNRAQHDLETLKAESERVLEAIKINSPVRAADNLRFLIDAGLVNAETQKGLLEYLNKPRPPGRGAALPPGGGAPGVDDGVTSGSGLWKAVSDQEPDIGKDEYKDQYTQPPRTWQTKNVANTTLVSTGISLENLSRDSQKIYLSAQCPGDTALVDVSGQAYRPMHYDSRTQGGLYDFPPKTKTSIVLLFETPKDITPKELRLSIVYRHTQLVEGCQVGYDNPIRDNLTIPLQK